jgi:histidine triad (HIT) family protein
MKHSPFLEYIEGKKENRVLIRTEKYLAFLEDRPLARGHVVVMPIRFIDDFFDLEAQELGDLMAFAKPIAEVLKAQYSCVKVGMAILGLATRHAHVHLVPISNADELNFTREKLNPPVSELDLEFDRIRKALSLQSTRL